MKITKTSKMTRVEHTREIDITEEQLALIQDVAPMLSQDDREFLISGMTPEEWEQAFGEEADRGE